MIRLTREISELQLQWRNHPDIRLWTRQNGLLSTGDQLRWLEKIESDPSIQMFGIRARWQTSHGHACDENVGTCGLTSINPTHGTAEFSLLIGPEYQKKGFGKAALIELLKYGFNHLRLNTIWGETFAGNPALKMFEDIGMKVEGKCRQRYFKNGFYVDSYPVSILRAEAMVQSWW